ncbi:hypothetical protein Sru01_43500 [Sphaerisporangium rufum]|uniref:Superoxide dismutase copper/zinc binding domain-containing protein n=1 Tax=Sphaerisporangium rufum TaxID=1381558 RepID=A0A919R4Y3_9ACTN|nr:superoxide dismutase family protein [Sphaerisporangium rufum]GII79368.1 hypothetical protein Sru01_43500 [Sphaerisporangium rufum]
MMEMRAALPAVLAPLTAFAALTTFTTSGAATPAARPATPGPPVAGPAAPGSPPVPPGPGARPAPPRPPAPRPEPFLALGRFEPYGPGRPAVTYDRRLVPPGTLVALAAAPGEDGRTIVQLRVQGLRPGHTYGAHVHVRPCGPTGEHAGPHYQNVPDPRQPSVDPAYANPRNEIWLDFTTDRRGDGQARAQVPWRVRGDSRRSVVVHAQRTSTAPGHAGMAGPRVACVDVNL